MSKGPRDLQREVLDRDLCTTCGLCVGLCPYLKTIRERVAVIFPCGLDEGNCYAVCPRTETDLTLLDREVFGQVRNDHVLGHHLTISYARARGSGGRPPGQYGGVVTAVLSRGLSAGELDACVVTGTGADAFPEPVIARTPTEVAAAAGSRYSACPTLTAFNQAIHDDLERIGVVGRPCQVTALRKMAGRESRLGADRARLVVGLFCFWALKPAVYDYLAQKVDLTAVRRMDIPQNDFVVYTDQGPVHFPFAEIKGFVKPTCELCFDVTSELADLSVGSTEHEEEWSTLIVRTARGGAAIQAALDAGGLEVKPYPPDRIGLLRTAVANKKRRVLAALQRLPGSGGRRAGYLLADEEYFEPFRSAREEGIS